MARIKELYVPEQGTVGAVINKMSKLDFTGAGAEDDTEDKKPKKKGPELDFT